MYLSLLQQGVIPAAASCCQRLLPSLAAASSRVLRDVLQSPLQHRSVATAVPQPEPLPMEEHDFPQVLRPRVPVPETFGYVHSTESFTAVDGPGVRFLVFLQGCGMRCVFCSNPDTWHLHGGKLTSSKDIMSRIRKVAPYLQHAQGGITCSGGEPMLQPEFVSALFQEAHAMGLSTCVDTTGQGTKHHSWDLVLPHTDLVLFCIKHLDPKKYQEMTGMRQQGALKFADELAAESIPYFLRYVFIPGLTDAPEDIDKLINFCHKQPTLQAIELLPYHVLGREKWHSLGLKYPLENQVLPTPEQVKNLVDHLRANDVNVLCDVK